MENCKEASTPVSISCYMDADLDGTIVDQKNFRGLIGSLLDLIANRPNIMFPVCLCARFQSYPKESHFKAAKRILKYLKGTSGTCHLLHFPIHLVGYSNSDFVGCKLDRKRAQVGLVISLAQVLYPGTTKSKLVFLFQLL